MYNKTTLLTPEVKTFIKNNSDKKPKDIAQELNIKVEHIRWFLWSVKKKDKFFDFNCCPITGFQF